MLTVLAVVRHGDKKGLEKDWLLRGECYIWVNY